MKIIKRCAILLCVLTTLSHAQGNSAYPNKPIRLIIPLAAGIVTTKISQSMRQTIAIENLLGAAGTPKDIIKKLNAEVVKALAEPDVRDKVNQQGVTPRGTSAAELGMLTKAQFEKCARLIKAAGIKAD